MREGSTFQKFRKYADVRPKPETVLQILPWPEKWHCYRAYPSGWDPDADAPTVAIKEVQPICLALMSDPEEEANFATNHLDAIVCDEQGRDCAKKIAEPFRALMLASDVSKTPEVTSEGQPVN